MSLSRTGTVSSYLSWPSWAQLRQIGHRLSGLRLPEQSSMALNPSSAINQALVSSFPRLGDQVTHACSWRPFTFPCPDATVSSMASLMPLCLSPCGSRQPPPKPCSAAFLCAGDSSPPLLMTLLPLLHHSGESKLESCRIRPCGGWDYTSLKISGPNA